MKISTELADEELALSAWGEAWAERAAILEHEAGMTREDAEKEADRLHPQSIYLKVSNH